MAPATRYIVTLDSDTRLPPGRLRELVSVAAHPANQPRLDPTRTHRGERLRHPAAARGHALAVGGRVHALPLAVCRAVRCDPYSAASSEVYQDLSAKGTFTGKGLLHVGAVHAVLAGPSARRPGAQP
jgi:cyclic beta-1,2-glucan synthetase